jgi:hypothetical protein
MTFGQIKSLIENRLVESYRDEKEFKKYIREFKHNVLKNKSLSKLYSLYDQLSTPQSLSESDANIFLNEGLNLIEKILSEVKLPTADSEVKNSYTDIDNLIYSHKLDLRERLENRKKIINVLKSDNKKLQESFVKLPITSMVKIANQTLESYVEKMDEQSKKMFFNLLKSDTNVLQENYQTLKDKTLEKLDKILQEQNEEDLKNKINETIDKLKLEEFNQLSYLKLMDLEKNL